MQKRYDHRTTEKKTFKSRLEVYRPTQYFLIGLAVLALGITVVAIGRLI